jgi:hypothetical protein
MQVLVVIPVADVELGERCLLSATMDNSASGIDPKDILVVDNTRLGNALSFLPSSLGVQYYRDPDNHNIGVPRAWNIGARKVVEEQLDYLVIMSQSMLFGPIKETTWIKQMETFMGENVIESDGHSWHLIALHRRLFEKVGYFDENFYPGYFEQIDWCYRLELNNLQGAWARVWVNALSQTVGHHSDLVLAPPLLDYYREKWGGDKGEEKFELPFGDKPIGYFPDNSIPDLAEKYKLKEWW